MINTKQLKNMSKKIPFDVKFKPQIESGEYKVETRDGRPARILCWDKVDNCGQYIVALVQYTPEHENIISVCENGIYHGSYGHDYDLFLITPVPEMSEFEKALSKCLCDAVVRPEEEDYDKWAKEYAPELLEFARKELIVEQLTSVPRKTSLYKMGKFEALKDLPRWRKGACFFEHGDIGQTSDGDDILSYRGYEILLAELEKLPKDE